MVHPYPPEKRDAGGKIIDVQSGLDTRTKIFQAVGERIGKFEVCCRTRLLHMVAAYGNGIESGHAGCGVPEYVGHDAHGRPGRIYVRIAHHEFLQNVVLNGAGKHRGRNALLLCGHDVKGHHGQHGAVHGHRHGYPFEGDSFE